MALAWVSQDQPDGTGGRLWRLSSGDGQFLAPMLRWKGGPPPYCPTEQSAIDMMWLCVDKQVEVTPGVFSAVDNEAAYTVAKAAAVANPVPKTEGGTPPTLDPKAKAEADAEAKKSADAAAAAKQDADSRVVKADAPNAAPPPPFKPEDDPAGRLNLHPVGDPLWFKPSEWSWISVDNTWSSESTGLSP